MNLNKFKYIKALWSPFKPFKIKWYVGKTKIGTPYFYPRKAVNDPDKPGYLKFVPKRIGFDVVGLGYKTKWSDTDYRFEWSPLVSFVFFGYQIAAMVSVPERDHYWAAWLYYENNTDPKQSKRERIEQCKKEFPLNYIVYTKDTEYEFNYYNSILKNNYK